jgi:hypothetical protein
MFQTKVVERIETHILCSITPLSPPESRAVLEVMWKNVALRRPQMTIWHMRIGCWIHKATNTHSHYVVIIAFPVQQWLHERALMLRYKTCIACLLFHCHHNLKRSMRL